jgi:hypothetical protein
MKTTVLWALLCMSIAGQGSLASAKYRRPDLEQIPVERLLENLARAADKDPKDARVRFNLARAHAMAYANKTDSVEIQKAAEDKGVWFGFEPKNVPFVNMPTEDNAKQKEAQEQLVKAILRYQETIKLDPKNLPAKLGLAWCLEQSGEKAKAIKAYREVIDEAWAEEQKLDRAGLGFRPITSEGAEYLIPLLNEKKDQDEIIELTARADKLKKLPRPMTPLAIPLTTTLAADEVADGKASVSFDADGSGLEKRWTWIHQDAGWLVYDRTGSGQITSALQLFGSVTFWMFWDNGFEALASLDNNADGQISGAEMAGLAIWQDKNGNGRSEPGEVRPLAAWGITSLSCQHDTHHLPKGVCAVSPRGVTFHDGTTRGVFDVVLERR